MTYKIEFTRAAEKQLVGLSKTEFKKLSQRIDRLALNPFPSGHEKMSGYDEFYRVRQGDYRIIYSVFQQKLLVLVVKIGHRREIYRT